MEGYAQWLPRRKWCLKERQLSRLQGKHSLFLSLVSVIVEEPNLKKCVIKGDNWNVKGLT